MKNSIRPTTTMNLGCDNDGVKGRNSGNDPAGERYASVLPVANGNNVGCKQRAMAILVFSSQGVAVNESVDGIGGF